MTRSTLSTRRIFTKKRTTRMLTQRQITAVCPEEKTFVAEFDTELKNVHPCPVSPWFITRNF